MNKVLEAVGVDSKWTYQWQIREMPQNSWPSVSDQLDAISLDGWEVFKIDLQMRDRLNDLHENIYHVILRRPILK